MSRTHLASPAVSRAPPWAALLAFAFVVRTALDWLAPPADFHTRSTVSTLLAAGILALAGLWGSCRSGSIVAGTVIGVLATVIGAVVSILGAAGLLAIFHDPETMTAIRHSGGLGEAFTLPIVMILPGAVIGTIAGVVGVAVKKALAA